MDHLPSPHVDFPAHDVSFTLCRHDSVKPQSKQGQTMFKHTKQNTTATHNEGVTPRDTHLGETKWLLSLRMFSVIFLFCPPPLTFCAGYSPFPQMSTTYPTMSRRSFTIRSHQPRLLS
jgi:hypothetical protein